MLIRKAERGARRRLTQTLTTASRALDRRTFLRRSGLAGGALAALGTLPLCGLRKAEAAG